MTRAEELSPETILSMDACALSNAIQIEKRLTCEKLMEITLDRIEAINHKFNAIILLRDRNELMEQARCCDEAVLGSNHEVPRNGIATTMSGTNQLGWLKGIPIAIKDVSHAKGFPTTLGGSRLFSATLPMASSDTYVSNLEASGAIIIGKTNAPEGGLGSNTFNPIWGKTVNAFFDDQMTSSQPELYSAGGSSGGAAVAIATKMLAIADGTDNMGSLRNPAGWNGIYSIRPTAGLIPSNSIDLSPRLSSKVASAQIRQESSNTEAEDSITASILPFPASTPGPMARTPRDCARVLETMVGDLQKFDASPLLKDDDYGENPSRTVRIGWLGNWNGRLPMETGVLSTCYDSLEFWKNVSSNIELVEPSGYFELDEIWEAYNTIRFASTYETYSKKYKLDVESMLLQSSHHNSSSNNENNGWIKEELAWELKQGQAIVKNKKALEKAGTVYERYAVWLNNMFTEEVDFLALPSAQVWPFPIDENYPKEICGVKMDTYHRWMEVCVPVSFGGLPCVTLPSKSVGIDIPKNTDKSPITSTGIQLFTNRGGDIHLLRLASDYYRQMKKKVLEWEDACWKT